MMYHSVAAVNRINIMSYIYDIFFYEFKSGFIHDNTLSVFTKHFDELYQLTFTQL